ncbi:hypothetical protein [Sulfoacidibacillus thermotolerans]|uniref:Uncharacterized protein n=1 Tax=Sulfoacidibacillus thermotolerans TaxID=1765684 RepID=A0A2U3D959_SULT2|nr:hypothetical protein [Sulfoacidibacillus thermotolerans]PWI57822.1 hypothetical protein BM613_06425 [Sulfoacidibacillus thermotolerans]
MERLILHSRFALFIFSISSYVLAVNGKVVSLYTNLDARGAIVLHALINWLLVSSGLLLGLGIGVSTANGAQQMLAVLLPQWPPKRVQSLLHSIAALVIVLAMSASVFWGLPALEFFVDHHPVLLFESDLLLYGMGLFTGVAWVILLQSYAWFGFFLSSIGMLMVITNVLSENAW